MFSVPMEPLLEASMIAFAATLPPLATVRVPDPELPTVRIPELDQREPVPVTVTVLFRAVFELPMMALLSIT